MGLGAYFTAWWRQTRHFGHTHASTYSSLVFDNRGMGKSDKPSMRYSTSEMAKDAIDLVDSLGWTGERELHVIGVSMGGMIAQEVAIMIPQRIASLVLVSTAPRLINEVGYFQNLRNRINMFVPREINFQLEDTKKRLFSAKFLEEPDRDADQSSGRGWPTNGDRFSAGELLKRQDVDGFTKKGFILQAIAAGWHHKSEAQLRELGDKVGRQRICVMHGTVDGMISFTHAGLLRTGLGEGIEYHVFEGKGHVLGGESLDEFNSIVERMVEKGSAL